MKHLTKPFKYLIGILFILFKCMMFSFFFIALLIWNFDLSFFTELHEIFFDSFYVSECFNMGLYRYLTLTDYVNDNKCYIYRDEFFKEP